MNDNTLDRILYHLVSRVKLNEPLELDDVKYQITEIVNDILGDGSLICLTDKSWKPAPNSLVTGHKHRQWSTEADAEEFNIRLAEQRARARKYGLEIE